MGCITIKKLIDIPDNIHEILAYYKEVTGCSVSEQIKHAILRFLVHEKLLTIKRRTVYIDEEKKVVKKKVITPSVGVKFCDGDSCEVPLVPLQKGC